MSEEPTGRIWKPFVQTTETIVPKPGSLNDYQHQQQQQFYTKTSLVANRNERGCSLNREILSASQSYNNIPKPFTRSSTQSPILRVASGNNTLPRATATSNCFNQQQQQQQVRFSQQQALDNPNHQSINQDQRFTNTSSSVQDNNDRSKESAKNQQEENMVPKLVHKQYNSPIDLYSMNNIRKTIEAHTELIAPGVKGINFMKPDTPVNKQSEVYKLVMEEEEQRSRRASPSRVSPISGQQVNFPSNLAVDHQTTHVQRQPLAAASSQQQKSGGAAPPTCCECGLFIVGPFAKIQNRFVHPQCFNCTTCGTSLKNSGYFTVNDKLYCEIHAKQVAHMMHIQYDFAEKQANHCGNQQSTTATTRQQQHLSSSSSSSVLGRQPCSGSTSPATISTMFASRNTSEANNEKREVKWAWRPMTSKDRTSTIVSSTKLDPSSSSRLSPAPGSYYPQEQQQQHQVQQHRLQQHQQSMVVPESTLVGGRIPICVHCHVQIHGPYILAGTTTWCKLCSQAHFNCSACRRSLLDIGFIEDSSHKYYCEHCFEAYYAPVCSKCNIRIKGDCLNALGKQWHPSCFICGHCRRPFGNSSFYLEDNVPYCERDWNILFTTKCYACSYPIEAGDKWIEALDRNYHSNCFRCTSCQTNLEGSTFYCKGSKPYCRLHAR